jgi:hypothetical protein
VEITFTDTEVKLAGGLGGWLDSLPQFSVPQLPEALQVGWVASGSRDAESGSRMVGQ